MIPKECKRLAEVDFPIAEVSKQATREKSIRHGHPSTLHLWWARRPLASSRAMLLGLLLPDPCDPHCPQDFKDEAREILLEMEGRPQGWTELAKSDEGLRQIFIKFISDFANWDNAANTAYLSTSRTLIRAVHGNETPLVVDPFAGGGSIPLEALRLGCETFASDLNPVACLILKVLLEEIPRHGRKLAEELRKVGEEIHEKAKEELADFYPKYSDGSTPIAYLWARTVHCEAPDCGAEIPLMRSMWLSNKSNNMWAIHPKIKFQESIVPQVELDIFQPKHNKEVSGGTVSGAKATCLCCSIVLPSERVRAQLIDQKGGSDVIFDKKGKRIGGARLMAVVTLKQKVKGRNFRAPDDNDYSAVFRAQERLSLTIADWKNNKKQSISPIPNELLPPIGTLGFRVQRYGMLQWSGIFTTRQKFALTELIRILLSLPDEDIDLLRLSFGLLVGRLVDYMSAQCIWHIPKQLVAHTFGRQALPMTWDFCEIFPFGNGPGNFSGGVQWISKVIESWPKSNSGQSHLADATKHPLPDKSAQVWFTDPPYYDAIPYSDLSDFFLVWLKRSLPDHPMLRDPFDSENPLSPKNREIVQDETKKRDGRVKDRDFFEDAMGEAFTEGRRVLREDGIGSVIFAHKTTEGWEALLSGMINGGWTITASWPIATEMGSRLRAKDSAALATSVHLVCRPRPEDAPVGDWADVLRELPKRVGDWMERLQGEGIRGADLVFACVGPALEIFSRCSRVETAEGQEVKLPEYLEKVWEVVGRTALEQVLGTAGTQAQDGLRGGVLEEDSRLTALFLWTLQSTGDGDGENEEDVAKASAGGFSLPYDVVRRFAQPMGIDLDAWTGRIIEQKKGVVRLLPVTERSKALFGQEGASAAADWIETDPMAGLQQALFAEADGEGASASRARGGRLDPDAEIQTSNPTALDRLHAAMLLQASGHTNALRALIAAEQDRGPDFLRLANALTALYPRGSQEKRLLDAMLLAVPR